MKIMILAGGRGTRLWPLSTEEYPKQFLRFGGEESLLQKTVQRFVKRGLAHETFIVTHSRYAPFVKRDLLGLLPELDEQIIIEPDHKNTAPALTWGIKHLLIHRNMSFQELILMVPIDHHFSDEEAFMEKVWQAKDVAERGAMISFGVPCRYAETGYGYLQMLNQVGEDCFKVGRFIEKPSQEIAEEFVKNARWLWNIGVYLFRVDTYLKELHVHASQLSKLMEGEHFYEKLAPISIDKALMEHSTNLCVMQLTEGFWCDVGSWEGIVALMERSMLLQT